jgi:riboflavin biosynthesis pyrimidine reductase
MELGLVDEYRFVVGPIVPGEGTRLLEGVSLQERLQLKLLSQSYLNQDALRIITRNSDRKNLRQLCCWPPPRGDGR